MLAVRQGQRGLPLLEWVVEAFAECAGRRKPRYLRSRLVLVPVVLERKVRRVLKAVVRIVVES